MRNWTTNMQSAVRILILVVIIIVLWWLLFAEKDNRLKLGVDDNINVTQGTVPER